jgi:hypothetical protein
MATIRRKMGHISTGCLNANVRDSKTVVRLWWFPVHIERVVTEAVDVLRQVRADTGQSVLWGFFSFCVKLPNDAGQRANIVKD